MHCCQKGRRILSVPSGNAAPLLQSLKGILNQAPQAIEIFIILALLFPVLFGWNHGLHTSALCQLDDFVTVIAFVRNQIVCIYPFNKFACLCAIRCGTCCNKHSDRITMRIHGQMYL